MMIPIQWMQMKSNHLQTGGKYNEIKQEATLEELYKLLIVVNFVFFSVHSLTANQVINLHPI